MSQCILLLSWGTFGRCVAVDGCGMLVLGWAVAGWRCGKLCSWAVVHAVAFLTMGWI